MGLSQRVWSQELGEMGIISDGVTNSLKSLTGCGVWGEGERGRSGAGYVARDG
ncbi:hypothetical protein [Moorena sp. SIO3F7]|uniref:hypothetical protein n=1 Tax=Moorena sp. SIO3F7 TaxID=2607839 RepID=UPI0025E68544|nr:hypothetical protein [Moorena sp. SIO3F7]